jgi:phosphatidylglycerol---prolipoprotein diacylglyceryl transferase
MVTMHPVLFSIGSFPVGTYGILLALSALAAIALGRMLAPRANLDPERLVDLFVFSLLGAFVGAKVALVMGDFQAFADHPGRFLLENLRSFGAFYGGFFAGVAVAIYYLRKHGIPFYDAADVTVVCLALGQAMGRWGCFFAGCCYGKPTDLPWGMVFPAVPLCADGTRIHPWPLYESLADLAIFGLLIWLFGRRKFAGQVLLVYVMTYAVARGLLEFLRGDEVRGIYMNGTVSLSQIFALVAFSVALALYAWRRKTAVPG